MLKGFTIGAPGIYGMPEEPVRAITGARMDVCAFVGVAPRGPARPPRFEAPWADRPCDRYEFPRSIAVPVESFDAYWRLYGAFEGPGLLPYAVASFFEQGGRRAYIVRIVHLYRDAAGQPDAAANARRVASAGLRSVASGHEALATTGGDLVTLRARDEGGWGNSLAATLSFTARPIRFISSTTSELVVAPELELPAGSLLRVTQGGGVPALRYVMRIEERSDPGRLSRRRTAVLSGALASPAISAEMIEGVLDVDERRHPADRTDRRRRTERHDRLGLSSLHPRWLASVLYRESTLLYSTAGWIDGELDLSDPHLPSFTSDGWPVTFPDLAAGAWGFSGGQDDYARIVPEDFFDDFTWTLGDDCPGAGIHALVNLPDVGSVVVPDLYSPGPLVPVELLEAPSSLAGAEFARCVELPAPPEQAAPPEELLGLQLDPRIPADLARIVSLQQRVVELGDVLQSFIVLLDVPPGLRLRQVLEWRNQFDSAYAAAYHPWLLVSRRDDRRDALVRVNPSAVAAGIIADREAALGIPHGPANVIATGVVQVGERVSPAHHDELHPQGINVYLIERDGVRLTGARTLARDPAWRQLSVRRLITMLRRTLDQQMQWAVFEPNNPGLWSEIRHLLEAYLRRLYRANAFRGATEAEAFFVKCDEEVNTRGLIDQGRLLAYVGVAPAEPLEFIVLQIARDGDGTLRVQG
jgi:uncharacterized protein